VPALGGGPGSNPPVAWIPEAGGPLRQWRHVGSRAPSYTIAISPPGASTPSRRSVKSAANTRRARVGPAGGPHTVLAAATASAGAVSW